MSLCAQCIVKDISYTEFGLVSFYGGIQRSKTFFSQLSGWFNTHYAKQIHVLKEGMVY